LLALFACFVVDNTLWQVREAARRRKDYEKKLKLADKLSDKDKKKKNDGAEEEEEQRGEDVVLDENTAVPQNEESSVAAEAPATRVSDLSKSVQSLSTSALEKQVNEPATKVRKRTGKKKTKQPNLLNQTK
jgi:hypothetical protein